MKKRAAKSKGRSARAKPRAAKPRKRPSKARPVRAKGRAAPSAAKPKKRPATRSPAAPAPRRSGRAARRAGGPRPRAGPEDAGRITGLYEARIRHHETSPALSGGDLDADWTGSEGSGDESVGGSVATPDQDVVDEIGRALGVEQAPSQPVTSSEDILRERSRRRWEMEREASEEDDRRER